MDAIELNISKISDNIRRYQMGANATRNGGKRHFFQGLPGDGVGRGIITFVGFVSGSSGAPSRLFAYLQRRSLEDWAPYASVASYVLPRCL